MKVRKRARGPLNFNSLALAVRLKRNVRVENRSAPAKPKRDQRLNIHPSGPVVPFVSPRSLGRVKTGRQKPEPVSDEAPPVFAPPNNDNASPVAIEESNKRELAFQIRQRAAEARAKLHELCRNDVNAFCEFVMMDDATGQAIEQSPFHLRLQRELTQHRQIVVMSHPDSGKTNNIAVGRVLWELGRDPNKRIMLLYNAEDSAMKTLSTIRKYIESSEELKCVFPHLKRGHETWKDDSIIVARTAYSRDPSVTAVGYNSRRIQGSRIDLLIIDDLLDAQVTATESQRRKLSSWVKSTVLTRLTINAMVAFLTNAWHPRDLAHEFVNERGWHLIKRPIRDPDGKIWWWRWTEDRLSLIRKSLGALEYARSYECDPRDDGSRVFRPEHVEHALKRGQGYACLHRLSIMPDNAIIVTGVDVAAGDDTKKQGAKTVLTSVYFHPNQDRQIVRIRAGRWRARQIIDEVNACGHIFHRNHWIVVETNNVQRWLLDLAQEHEMDVGVTLVPFQTGRNKLDPRFGVASMSAEFEAHRWILPSSCEREDETAEIEALVAQMIDYVPEAHTGDHLMSLWFAREIGRKIFQKFFGGDGNRREGSIVRAIG